MGGGRDDEMGVVIALGALDAFLRPLTSRRPCGPQRLKQYSSHFILDEAIQPQRV